MSPMSLSAGSFVTIQINTALKQDIQHKNRVRRFVTIQINTALKH